MGNLIKANRKEVACKKLVVVLKKLREKLSLHEVYQVVHMAEWHLREDEDKKQKPSK